MKKEKVFTIGQFAALHNINKKTLMWYDEIGLFKPAVIQENGYRCYTYSQSPRLETILMLRELHMSIPEIQRFLGDCSMEGFVCLLEEKMAEVDRETERLKNIRGALAEQHTAFSGLLHADLTRVDLVEREEELLYLVASERDLSLEDEIETVIEAARAHKIKSLRDAAYGSIIAVSSLMRSEFDQYDGLFMKVSQPVLQKGVHVKPRGRYLRAYCRGSWDRLPDRYRDLLQYARERELSLWGYAYETGVNERAITSIDEYITQIEIPVKGPEPQGG